MRLVLDTNILVSALITKDTPPDRLYQAWLNGMFRLVSSRAQMSEVADVLARPRIQRYLNRDEAAVIVENIDTRAIVLDNLPDVDLSPDPKDNPILATAIAGKADLLVTGDKRDLLALGSIRGIQIVTARDAIERLNVP